MCLSFIWHLAENCIFESGSSVVSGGHYQIPPGVSTLLAADPVEVNPDPSPVAKHLKLVTAESIPGFSLCFVKFRVKTLFG
jgi:hypothetical protein